MINKNDIGVLGFMGIMQFLVSSRMFQIHYAWIIIYSCLCFIYIIYKLGCNSQPYWTIGKKLMFWIPIVVSIGAIMIFYLSDDIAVNNVLLFVSAGLNCIGLVVLTIIDKKYHSLIGHMDFSLYVLYVVFCLFCLH